MIKYELKSLFLNITIFANINIRTYVNKTKPLLHHLLTKVFHLRNILVTFYELCHFVEFP